jgi:hypothetical protein
MLSSGSKPFFWANQENNKQKSNVLGIEKKFSVVVKGLSWGIQRTRVF